MYDSCYSCGCYEWLLWGLCEECAAEAEDMRTCGECGREARVIQGHINAYYECMECGDTWM